MIVFSATGRIFEFYTATGQLPIVVHRDVGMEALTQLTEGYMACSGKKSNGGKSKGGKSKPKPPKKPKALNGYLV